MPAIKRLHCKFSLLIALELLLNGLIVAYKLLKAGKNVSIGSYICAR